LQRFGKSLSDVAASDDERGLMQSGW
jgi:hypothetical protein